MNPKFNSLMMINKNNIFIFSVHNPSIIPTVLDLEFYRIFPNRSYDFRFNKHIAYLKPPPFKTNCRNYYRSNPKGCKMI